MELVLELLVMVYTDDLKGSFHMPIEYKAIINIMLVSCPQVQHKLMQVGGDY